MQNESNGSRGLRALDKVGQTTNALRRSDTNWEIEYMLSDLRDPRKIRATTCNNETAREHVETPRLLQLSLDQGEHLRHPRLDDLGEHEFRENASGATTGRGNLKGVVLTNTRRYGRSVLAFNLLCGREWGAKASRDVVRDVISTYGQYGRKLNRPAVEHRDAAGTTTDIEQAHAQLLLLL
jgi:hypothetical protein